MSHRIAIRSRSGNVALGVVGAIYFVSALLTLMLYVVSSWGGASLLDHLLQLMLVASALAGAFLLATAAGNLGIDFRARRRHT
jgi:hypothetical protein